MKINKQQFWNGVSILLNNYHAVNRKVFACSIIKVNQIEQNLKEMMAKNTGNACDNSKEIDKSSLISQLLQISKGHEFQNTEGFVIQFKMIFESDEIADFEIRLSGELFVEILKDPKAVNVDFSSRWRDYLLKPKFYKWCLNENANSENLNETTSLRLVDLEKYNRIYNSFKRKYSESALKFWNDAHESTDPLKYIYEDLAIAAYLITLWHSDMVDGPPTAFADLGCGNGLLVYLLIQEGYLGYGYDVRARKLWSFYPKEVSSHLCEEVVVPFKFNLPAEVDWLIGNHSDELSPWLPVLAKTCRKNINFFLLPCCPFEFSGNKFQRRCSSVSGYKDFCNYAQRISNVCGFRTLKDRLKIPSTKRNAIIGLSCLSNDYDFLTEVQRVKEFVKHEQQQHPNSSFEDIKLREKSEAVRNCTQVEKSLVDSIVNNIFFLLLEKNSNAEDSAMETRTDWQCGTRLTMSEIAKKLDREKLKKIKSECGGLKTLLRNKHEIFQFEKPDFVLIRKPQIQTINSKKPQTIKKRKCYFKSHHPQGCPLKDEECTFIH